MAAAVTTFHHGLDEGDMVFVGVELVGMTGEVSAVQVIACEVVEKSQTGDGYPREYALIVEAQEEHPSVEGEDSFLFEHFEIPGLVDGAPMTMGVPTVFEFVVAGEPRAEGELPRMLDDAHPLRGSLAHRVGAQPQPGDDVRVLVRVETMFHGRYFTRAMRGSFDISARVCAVEPSRANEGVFVVTLKFMGDLPPLVHLREVMRALHRQPRIAGNLKPSQAICGGATFVGECMTVLVGPDDPLVFVCRVSSLARSAAVMIHNYVDHHRRVQMRLARRVTAPMVGARVRPRGTIANHGAVPPRTVIARLRARMPTADFAVVHENLADAHTWSQVITAAPGRHTRAQFYPAPVQPPVEKPMRWVAYANDDE